MLNKYCVLKVSLVLCKIHLYGNSSLPDHTKTILLNNRNKLEKGSVGQFLGPFLNPSIQLSLQAS